MCPLTSSEQAKKIQHKSKSQIIETMRAEHDEKKLPLSMTIHKKTPEEVFQLLKLPENLPYFFENLSKTEFVSENKNKWFFDANEESPEAFDFVMQSEFDENSPALLWRSEDGAGFDYSVAIELERAQANRGTIARMTVVYDNKAGKFASLFEKFMGKDAETVSRKILGRIKAFCETGSVPTTKGQPSGRAEDLPQLKH
ncbi:hypothetical protein DOM22_11200 [Bdellovibrio sp. ZAP7]|uniref:SRPBCC family protein n=1 Tax=Bdellovibrio sp. ZAP7 TaxID=2231053 RepID=UPI0011645BF8|nr:hypothetical protein [Bdellovibrio sp. ZAP7]QDK45672.1 hypothetical protein DOM22_11200 [Bdellovibrio sp. ZAP7]